MAEAFLAPFDSGLVTGSGTKSKTESERGARLTSVVCASWRMWLSRTAKPQAASFVMAAMPLMPAFMGENSPR